MSNICPHCGQTIKEAREHDMTGYLVDLLKLAANHVIATGVNDFKKGDIARALETHGASAYGNFPHLRYFGLIHHPIDRSTRQKSQRRWLITHQGWQFLRGEYACRKSVTIKDNHIVDGLSSGKRVYIRDVGSTEMQTDFDYFDDYGHMVGKKPMSHNVSQQMSLV